MSKTVIIDTEECIGCETCVELCKDIFAFNDDESKAYVIKEEGGRLTVRMVSEDPNASPDDPDVQAAIGEYYAYLNRCFYTCEVSFLRGLADMWAADSRFAVNYERVRPGGAAFVREAVHIYCDRNG